MTTLGETESENGSKCFVTLRIGFGPKIRRNLVHLVHTGTATWPQTQTKTTTTQRGKNDVDDKVTKTYTISDENTAQIHLAFLWTGREKDAQQMQDIVIPWAKCEFQMQINYLLREEFDKMKEEKQTDDPFLDSIVLPTSSESPCIVPQSISLSLESAKLKTPIFRASPEDQVKPRRMIIPSMPTPGPGIGSNINYYTPGQQQQPWSNYPAPGPVPPAPRPEQPAQTPSPSPAPPSVEPKAIPTPPPSSTSEARPPPVAPLSLLLHHHHRPLFSALLFLVTVGRLTHGPKSRDVEATRTILTSTSKRLWTEA